MMKIIKNRHGRKQVSGFYFLKIDFYRLFLNLLLLSTFGFLIWFGIRLFGEHAFGATVGSIVFIVSFVFFIWLRRHVKRNSWRSPSIKLTVVCLVALFVVTAFAGVQPVAGYKDKAIERVTAFFDEQKIKAEAKLEQAEREQEEKRIEEERELKRELSEVVVAMPPAITKATPKTSVKLPVSEVISINEAEELAFDLINEYRKEKGVSSTVWDDRLYELSLAHTKEMAKRGELFHGSGDVIGENAWGGNGYSRYNGDDLAIAIVSGWVTSPLHEAWLLYAPIKESVVSIVVTDKGQFASWTFWTNKLSGGPDLIMKISREYKKSGSNLDWISWLKSKGYLD